MDCCKARKLPKRNNEDREGRRCLASFGLVLPTSSQPRRLTEFLDLSSQKSFKRGEVQMSDVLEPKGIKT